MHFENWIPGNTQDNLLKQETGIHPLVNQDILKSRAIINIVALTHTHTHKYIDEWVSRENPEIKWWCYNNLA